MADVTLLPNGHYQLPYSEEDYKKITVTTAGAPANASFKIVSSDEDVLAVGTMSATTGKKNYKLFTMNDGTAELTVIVNNPFNPSEVYFTTTMTFEVTGTPEEA